MDSKEFAPAIPEAAVARTVPIRAELRDGGCLSAALIKRTGKSCRSIRLSKSIKIKEHFMALISAERRAGHLKL